MDLQEYISEKYNNSFNWFEELVNEPSHTLRIQDIHSKKEYLNGQHNILNSPSYIYNGRSYSPRKIVLSYAKTLLNFQKSFLLANPIVFTGEEGVVKEVNNINRKGKMDRFNNKVLHNLLAYGECYEYVYIEDNKIKSRLIDSEEGYPIYNHNNTLIGFVQYFINDGISYYVIYDKNYVREYNNAGGELHLVGEYRNLSGLPIVYKTDNELSHVKGKSDLDDWIFILDELEVLLSKFSDTVYKNMNPIPISIGQNLSESPLSTNIVGQGLQLDDGSDFKFANIHLDVDAFKTLYNNLLESLFNISNTPNVAMNKSEIANISETSIRILYSLANIKGKINEDYMREGLEERVNKYRVMLRYLGIEYSDDDFETIDIQFTYNIPSNDSEIINNLQTLYSMKSISLESVLEKSPYINDSTQELQRLEGDTINNQEIIESPLTD